VRVSGSSSRSMNRMVVDLPTQVRILCHLISGNWQPRCLADRCQSAWPGGFRSARGKALFGLRGDVHEQALAPVGTDELHAGGEPPP
jgi:hypothetical protein